MNITDYIKEVCDREPIQLPNNVNTWKSWYSGKVDTFHNYRLYNGQNSIDRQKRSLLMAKTACEDWANLLANENTQIKIKEQDQELLDTILRSNDFSVRLNDCIEKSFALGNGFIVLGLTNVMIGKESGRLIATEDTNITIDFVDFLSVIPLTIERNKITECAFVSKTNTGIKLSIHLKDSNGKYLIREARFDKEENFINDYVLNTNSPLAWFVHIKPNINNNSLYYNELGCSIFANAIDVLKTIDDIYDGFSNEYMLARMKVFVADELWQFNKRPDGSVKKTFDPNDDLFYIIDKTSGVEGSDNTFFQVVAPQIRYDAYVNGLNTALNQFSKKCGFGTDYYKYDKGSIMTATQVISENSDLARSLRKQENLMRAELTKLTLTIIFINNNYTLNPKISDTSITDINILFDDSIIEDKNSVMTRDMQLVTAGLMTEAEFRTKHFGVDANESEKEYKEKFLFKNLDKYINALQAGAITPEEFIHQVYGDDYANKEALLEQITKSLEKANYNPLEAWEEEKAEEEPKEQE